MINILAFGLYAIVCAVAALALMVFNIIDAKIGALFGLVGVLCAMQIHGAILRRRTQSATSREIAELKRAGTQFAKVLEETRFKIEDARKAAETRANEQSRKIVSELQVLESLMREFASRISEKAKQVDPEEELMERRAQDTARSYLDAMGQSDLLETIRASLEENRVDLYLQPIVSLPQRKLRHYEALSRLRAEDGSIIMPAQYMKVAGPVGLMSVIDNLLLFRCVQIVRRLAQKNRGVGIFCNISGETLADAEFFPQFLDYMHHNRDLAAQIVFEFDQSCVLNAGQKGEESLIYLSNLGFALSMDHVTSLALDFDRLKSLGFRYLKVRAETLTSGMAHAQAAVAAEDLKALLQRYGVNLIAERVEDEKAVVQLLDYSVDFAQGYLFGEPRPVREDTFRAIDKVEQAPAVVPFRKAV
ncbi:MAG TPA: EAL domain-containing protein [Rhizomicrobium sp.]|nr:EAL domain-containing protein [Rhizomicrobium sp.]